MKLTKLVCSMTPAEWLAEYSTVAQCKWRLIKALEEVQCLRELIASLVAERDEAQEIVDKLAEGLPESAPGCSCRICVAAAALAAYNAGKEK